MDLLKIIKELHVERERIDHAIASLLTLTETGGDPDSPPILKKRRGRKSMSEEERKQVAKRMKEYWRKKRGS